MSCTDYRTHTDGKLALCATHAHAAKTAGAEVSLAQAKGTCQWKDQEVQAEPTETTPEEE